MVMSVPQVEPSQIVAASPRARQKALVLVALLAAAGVVALYWVTGSYLPGLRSSIEADPHAALVELRQVAAVLAAAVAVGIGALGISGVWRWRQVTRSGQSPHPGAWVLRDTRLLTGRAAVRKARATLAASLVVLALAPLVGYVLYTRMTGLIDAVAGAGRAAVEAGSSKAGPDHARSK